MLEDTEVEVAALKKMVCEVNETQVKRTDWLSDEVYYFNGESVELVKIS